MPLELAKWYDETPFTDMVNVGVVIHVVNYSAQTGYVIFDSAKGVY